MLLDPSWSIIQNGLQVLLQNTLSNEKKDKNEDQFNR